MVYILRQARTTMQRVGRSVSRHRTFILFVVLSALLVPAPLRAASLEFRSEGFFASPDGQLKFSRELWRYCPHLDVDGELAVNIEGPILRPGHTTLAGDATKTQLDPARRRWVDVGTLGKLAAPCSRTVSEYSGGMLVRLEYGPVPPEVTEAVCRLIFPVGVFKGRRARWEGGETVLPADKPDDKHLVFLSDPKGTAGPFRFDLGPDRQLGVKFLSRVQGLVLADCRQWNETNYHLQAGFAGRSMLLFVCLLRPGEPFPEVATPPEPAKAPEVKTTDEGAVFQVGNGLYEVLVAKSVQVSVRKKGELFVAVEPPSVREKDEVYLLSEPVNFEAKGGRVEVVSKVKGRPFRVRQSFAMEEDGWLSVSAAFEGMAANAKDTMIELVLPAKKFAGRTVRAAERFVTLPKDPPKQARLLDDWKGQVLDYDLPAEGPERLTLICDQKANSALIDYRPWGQQSFKIGMRPKDGAVQYRLHFWKEDEPPAIVKGNLLRGGASFETGPEGVRPYCCHSWYDKMVQQGAPPAFDTTTAVHGTTSLHLTAGDSVKLGNPHGFAFVGAAFNRVPLRRGHKYTVSAWLKADQPGIKAVIYCGETTWAGEDWGPFAVDTEWKRYHFSFYTADFKKSGYWLTWVGLDPQCKQGTLWIDAVQLEEGDLSDFRPAAEIEYGVEVPNKEKLFESCTPAAALLHVRNNGKQNLAGNVQYVVKDYWDQPARTGAVAVNVPADGTIAYPVDFGVLPCGYYRGYFTVPSGEVKELIFGVYQPQPLTPPPNDWLLGCHNDPMPLVRKLGFGTVRAFEIFEFSGIAPAKGKFDFSRSDRMVARARECGLSILPILGEFSWPGYRSDPPIPPYAQESMGENVLEGGRRVRVAWPTVAAWKDYVRALTNRYRGQIANWEVMNEPSLVMTPQQYVQYLQAAYEAAKEGDPDCRVVGVCATEDFRGKSGAAAFPFVDGVFKLGGTKYFDVLSVHLYHTNPPERTLEVGSDQTLEQLRKVMKDAYGKEAAVWNTERSYSSRQLAYSRRKVDVPLDYCEEPQFLIDNFRHKAEYMIRETLLNSVAGCGGRFYWFGQFDYETCFITVRYFQPYGLDHAEFDQSPCPELIAANGLARALEGMSHPQGQLSLGNGGRGCVFSGEKGSVAALWDCLGKQRIAIGVGKADFSVRDFFGEPIAVQPDATGQITVEIEGAPKYLLLPGLDAAACRRLLGRP